MIPYLRRHSGKQYIKSKPINFRYKLWCLNTNVGYLIQCDPYSGKGDHNVKLGLGGSVVARLVNKLPSEFSFTMTFDNLFTSLALLNHLYENRIGGTDTLRANCNDHYFIKGDLRPGLSFCLKWSFFIIKPMTLTKSSKRLHVSHN